MIKTTCESKKQRTANAPHCTQTTLVFRVLTPLLDADDFSVTSLSVVSAAVRGDTADVDVDVVDVEVDDRGDVGSAIAIVVDDDDG